MKDSFECVTGPRFQRARNAGCGFLISLAVTLKRKRRGENGCLANHAPRKLDGGGRIWSRNLHRDSSSYSALNNLQPIISHQLPSSSLSFGSYHVCSWLRSFDEVTLHRARQWLRWGSRRRKCGLIFTVTGLETDRQPFFKGWHRSQRMRTVQRRKRRQMLQLSREKQKTKAPKTILPSVRSTTMTRTRTLHQLRGGNLRLVTITITTTTTTTTARMMTRRFLRSQPRIGTDRRYRRKRSAESDCSVA